MNDSDLLKDARDTYNKCKLPPSEVLKQRNEAKILLTECLAELKKQIALVQAADLIIGTMK